MEGLVDTAYPELRPLLNFRNWLSDLRNQTTQRWSHRRNGDIGPGPFTLSARRAILQRLLRTQKEVGFQLITTEEMTAAKKEWIGDQRIERQSKASVRKRPTSVK